MCNFYGGDDIMMSECIRKNRDEGGKNQLPVCKYCFNAKVQIPVSQGNYKSNCKQKKA